MRASVLTATLLLCLLSAAAAGNGCRGGEDWYELGGSCYYWSNRTEGWFGAEKACQELGGHLVSISSRAENSFLHAMAQCNSEFWIGLAKTDVRQRGFKWWDDSQSNFTEPMSTRTTEYADCVHFYPFSGTSWINTYCQYLKNYVCMTPTKTETQQDEQQRQEENNGMVLPKCPTGWLSLEGNCYFVSSEKTNYFNAQMSCEAKDASVASVLSAREQTLLTMAVGCNTEAWIGLEKVRPCIVNPGQQFCWTWMDRTPLGYAAWHAGYPSNTKEVECATSDGRWKTVNCYNEYRYICKKLKQHV